MAVFFVWLTAIHNLRDIIFSKLEGTLVALILHTDLMLHNI